MFHILQVLERTCSNSEQTLSSVTLEYEEIYVISLFKRIQIRSSPPPLRRNSSLIFREFSSSTRRQNVKHLFWTSFSKCVADSPISNDTRRARHLSPRSYPGCTYPITSVSWSGIWIHPVWRYSDAFLKISYTATTHERETSKSPNVEIRCWIFSHDSSTVQTESNKNLANRRAQFFIVLVSRSNLSYTCPFPRIFTFLCCL